MQFLSGFITLNNNTAQQIPFALEGDAGNAYAKISFVNDDGLFELNLTALQDINLQNITIELEYRFDVTDKVFCNGFQSWTQTDEFGKKDALYKFPSLIKKYTEPFGDHTYYNYPQRSGYLHGWNFGFVRKQDDKVYFIGSVNEQNGFTLFKYLMPENKVVMEKDCKGLILKAGEQFNAFKLFIENGNEQDVTEHYLQHLNLPKIKAPLATGWTSWYYYYTHITEGIINDNLVAFKQNNVPIDIFQIDDGWQGAVGDWLNVNNKFGKGMRALSDNIHGSGYKAGLWLAPFVCEAKSEVCKNHPDWILKNDKGEKVLAGYNPEWSGNFYALDIYNSEFRQYLKKVFDTVLKDWNFDLVKLDFLYAACLHPQQGKTRGQIMYEACLLLRELCGDKMILGCGVPLQSCAGVFDYCRIGPDVGLSWQHKLVKWFDLREGISTYWSMKNALHRHFMNNRYFVNDPDVFILRDKKNKLKPEEKLSLFLTNQIFGGLVFTSDNISEYSPAMLAFYKSQFPFLEKKILYIEKYNDAYKVGFSIGSRQYAALLNYYGNDTYFDLSEADYYQNRDEVVYEKVDNVKLIKHQSMVVYKLQNTPYELLGSTGHLFSGSEVTLFEVKDNNITIQFHPQFINKKKAIIKVPDGVTQVTVNGKILSAQTYLEMDVVIYEED
jgi:alpha-galactosidase